MTLRPSSTPARPGTPRFASLASASGPTSDTVAPGTRTSNFAPPPAKRIAYDSLTTPTGADKTQTAKSPGLDQIMVALDRLSSAIVKDITHINALGILTQDGIMSMTDSVASLSTNSEHAAAQLKLFTLEQRALKDELNRMSSNTTGGAKKLNEALARFETTVLATLKRAIAELGALHSSYGKEQKCILGKLKDFEQHLEQHVSIISRESELVKDKSALESMIQAREKAASVDAQRADKLSLENELMRQDLAKKDNKLMSLEMQLNNLQVDHEKVLDRRTKLERDVKKLDTEPRRANGNVIRKASLIDALAAALDGLKVQLSEERGAKAVLAQKHDKVENVLSALTSERDYTSKLEERKNVLKEKVKTLNFKHNRVVRDYTVQIREGARREAALARQLEATRAELAESRAVASGTANSGHGRAKW